MYEKISIEDGLNMEDSIFIDVRSPLEFEEGTIYNAINIPILDNEERAHVGTIYKQTGTDEAKIKGIQYVSNKLTKIYMEVQELSKQYKNIIVFCWRGGLRSGSVASFLNSMGLNIYQLDGGYKKYRNHVLEYFSADKFNHEFIVLHGYTGVGKTEILEELEKVNIPVFNLERLAKNSGSVFGSLLYQNQAKVTQKSFEAETFEILSKSSSKYIVVESEGKRLGNVNLPDHVFSKILEGHQILINTSEENRVLRLVNDYVDKISCDDSLLESAIIKLKKRIGTEKVNAYIDWIKEKSYDKIARGLINDYYDPLYLYSINNYAYELEINYNNIDEAVDTIINVYHSLEFK